MAKINNFIKFYRDAYQYEYNTEKLTNFFSKKVTYRYFPETFKILNQVDFELPVDSAWGEEALVELTMHSSEKKLICGTFFVKGKQEVLGKRQKVFAPLYLHEVHLEYFKEVFTITVDHESINLNPIAVNYLNSIDPSTHFTYDELAEILLGFENPFTFDGLVQLSEALNKKYGLLDSSLLNRRIQVDERLSDLELASSSRKSSYDNLLFPDLAIGIIDKPKKSKDVIDELTKLSQANLKKQGLLNTVFNSLNRKQQTEIKRQKHNTEIVVPVSLSEKQENILQSAFESDCTLVIGPPGTGKSFTIAALAIQAVHEGKKVLIASKSEQACQVIKNKINHDIGIKGMVIDASKARYKISVAAKLRNIGSGIGIYWLNHNRFKKLRNEVTILKNTLNKLVKKISERALEEIKWGEKLTNQSKSFLTNLQKQWIKYRHSAKEPLWELKYQLHHTDIQLKKKEKQLIKAVYNRQLQQLLKSHRKEILGLERAFINRKGNYIKNVFSSVDYNIILQALPIWICKSTQIAEVLPLKEELFDILIIDEATQCDIASSIPLLYRAKSAVIVGDPNQLRHISFLSRRREAMIRSKYGLEKSNIAYRDISILDLVNQVIPNQEQVMFLDEHFRSMPDIIAFSNKYFYDNQLNIMTLHPGTEKQTYLEFVKVEGERNSKGENQLEAESILKE
ncbi:MAG: AAA domain-containing protein, partial [Bacteroidota bacterium]